MHGIYPPRRTRTAGPAQQEKLQPSTAPAPSISAPPCAPAVQRARDERVLSPSKGAPAATGRASLPRGPVGRARKDWKAWRSSPPCAPSCALRSAHPSCERGPRRTKATEGSTERVRTASRTRLSSARHRSPRSRLQPVGLTARVMPRFRLFRRPVPAMVGHVSPESATMYSPARGAKRALGGSSRGVVAGRLLRMRRLVRPEPSDAGRPGPVPLASAAM